VKSKPGCSARWTEFKSLIDERRIQLKLATGSSAAAKKQMARIRPPPGLQKVGVLERFPDPKKTSLDYFDVNSFNHLPKQARFRYRETPIALPEEDKHVFNLENSEEGKKWRLMSSKRFMRKYGDDLVKKMGYQIPTPEEMAEAPSDSDDDSSDSSL
jgi:hypothetical protein